MRWRYLKFRTLSGERCFKKFSPCVKEGVSLKRLITERNDIGLFTSKVVKKLKCTVNTSLVTQKIQSRSNL